MQPETTLHNSAIEYPMTVSASVMLSLTQ